MSRASKIFFASTMVLTTATVYGVHWLQKRESDVMYAGVLRDEERQREKAASVIVQPAPVISEDCTTCMISPPPELVEAQSAEARARERQARWQEYEAQKGLAARMEVAHATRTTSTSIVPQSTASNPSERLV